MKVLSFPLGKKPWRILVPASKSPTGKRYPVYFETKETAEKKLRAIKRFGRAAFDHDETDTASASVPRWDYLVERYGLSPEQIERALQREGAIAKTKFVTVREAVEAYQEYRAGKVARATLDTDRWRLLKLINTFERVRLSELTRTDLSGFLDDLGERMNVRSVYKSLRTFFGWAVEKGYVVDDPMRGIKPPGEFGINSEVYPVDTFKRMLEIAAGVVPVKPGKKPTTEFVDLLPWFALSGFCGLRSCEAFRIDSSADSIKWSDINFDRGFIHIRKEVAKSTRRKSGDERYIDVSNHLAPLRTWLELAPRDPQNPYVCRFVKRTMQGLKAEFTKQTGIKFVENGLRNSFASYALTGTGLAGVGALALQMGNSEAIARRYYVRTLEPGSGQAWFGIRPSRPSNVVPMRPAKAA